MGGGGAVHPQITKGLGSETSVRVHRVGMGVDGWVVVMTMCVFWWEPSAGDTRAGSRSHLCPAAFSLGSMRLRSSNFPEERMRSASTRYESTNKYGWLHTFRIYKGGDQGDQTRTREAYRCVCVCGRGEGVEPSGRAGRGTKGTPASLPPPFTYLHDRVGQGLGLAVALAVHATLYRNGPSLLNLLVQQLHTHTPSTPATTAATAGQHM